MIAYFNGTYLPREEISISPDDRGFLFADGLYEVIRAYNGRLFKTGGHINRLNHGAAHLNLGIRDFSYLSEVARQLLEKNGLTADATIYFQVTRGAAPRGHAFPEPSPEPTVFASASPFDPAPTRLNMEKGIGVILVPDQRWARCDMKTVGLTANVLANQQAKEKGAKEALFVRDGVILEGTHSNFMAVMDNCLVTAPASNYILHGITRKLVLALCAENDIPHREAPVFATDLPGLTEAFITGTTTEITPVTAVDGSPVGSGLPGPVTRKLQKAFAARIEEDCGKQA
ncbi:MAG: aminotransferase class IV [Desulfobacterales bacterium]|nr:aminotransferase class IV [Desulfobacterales bacterium]